MTCFRRKYFSASAFLGGVLERLIRVYTVCHSTRGYKKLKRSMRKEKGFRLFRVYTISYINQENDNFSQRGFD